MPHYGKANPNKRYPIQGHIRTQKNAATITPARPRPKTGCIIPAAAPADVEVDAPVEDEFVLLPVWVSVAVLAGSVCLTPPVVSVAFVAPDKIGTVDDGEETEGKLVLMTETTGG